MTKPPNILNYQHYQPFLKDFYKWKKKQDPHSSYRSLAKKADVSHAHLQGVMEGKRDLSLTLARKYLKFLNFKEVRQRNHFLLLAELNQKFDITFKDLIPGQALQLAMESFIMALVKSVHFKPDPAWISQASSGVLSQKKAKLLLNDMFKSKKLILKEGRVLASEHKTSVQAQPGDLDPIRAFHFDMLKKASHKRQSWYLGISTKEEMEETLNEFRRFWIHTQEKKHPTHKTHTKIQGELYSLFISILGNKLN